MNFRERFNLPFDGLSFISGIALSRYDCLKTGDDQDLAGSWLYHAGFTSHNESFTMQTTTLLTPKDATLLLVDCQPGLAFAVESGPRETLRQNIIALAKTAAVFDLPTVVTTSASKRFSGPIFPELQTALGALSPIERTSMNAWESAEVVTAVEQAGRKAIILAGLLTEACVAFTGISALAAGYRVLVIADACGASSPTAQDISIRLLETQGAELRTWLQLLLELQRDWTRSATYKGATDIVKAHAGAYGIGLNYAKAMIPAP